ncbi:hypothetical protein PBOI14_61090 [Pseudomonas sp. Boi14]|nr:hypothetical protein PBOI14_61090 [Pseudomonas sp. Boi14]
MGDCALHYDALNPPQAGTLSHARRYPLLPTCPGPRPAHDPFNAIVGPRPIGWISSQDREGRLNLAPYSFFNAFNYIPPIIGFSSVGRKDSLNNIEQTGEFAWNLATRPLAEQMNQSCAAVPAEVNEFELAGLTPVASKIISVPG